MSRDTDYNLNLQRSKRRYLSTLRYLKHIQTTGKIRLLTRSQVKAIQARLSRYLATFKRYLKLTTISTGLCAISVIDLDAQCQVTRLPISTQTSFKIMGSDNISTPGISAVPTFTDIDEDGDFDLVIGERIGGITLYENHNGFFIKSYGLLNPFNDIELNYTNAPTFIDMDMDGDQDAFIGESNETIRFFRNESGAFIEAIGNDNPLNNIDLVAPAFVDIDSDGDTDAFIGASDGTIHFFENENSTFIEVTGGANPFSEVDVGFSSYPTFVDIDMDEDQDVFIGASDGKIYFYENEGGSFIEVTGSGNPFNNVDLGSNTAPTFVDIDQDGDQDAFIGTSAGIIHFFRNESGIFNEISAEEIPFFGIDVGNNAAPAWGDLDGDGEDDIIVGAKDGTIRTFINSNGAFSEALGSNNPFEGINVGGYANPVLIDLDISDMDPDLDLFVGASDGAIHYFKNNNGIFSELSGASNPFNGVIVGVAAPAFVDFDGDNDKDAFIGSGNGTIRYFRNDNGTFNEIIGSGNPFNGVSVGQFASPSFFHFNSSQALVGNRSGKIIEFKKVGNQYVPLSNSSFEQIDVGTVAAPIIVDILPGSGKEIIIGNYSGNMFVFREQGGKSNVWQGPITSNWHGSTSNWELMTTPKSGCDEVHVFGGSVLKVDPTQIAEGKTLTVKQGGQFEVKAAAELSIDPD